MVKSSRIFRMYAENERRKFLEDSLKPILNQPLPICCGIEHLDLDRKCRFIGGVRHNNYHPNLSVG